MVQTLKALIKLFFTRPILLKQVLSMIKVMPPALTKQILTTPPDYKELGKLPLRLFTKNIAYSLNIIGTSCPVIMIQRPRYTDRAKVAQLLAL